uniref:(northern house mosquito) hypothetical protein n=1 Tax=Culex pipiens TaxID=7175 RepID=A0A8D8HV42_CULPI
MMQFGSKSCKLSENPIKFSTLFQKTVENSLFREILTRYLIGGTNLTYVFLGLLFLHMGRTRLERQIIFFMICQYCSNLITLFMVLDHFSIKFSKGPQFGKNKGGSRMK